MVGAVARLSVVSWDAIFRERFSATPAPLYDDIVKQAEDYLERFSGHAARRKARARARSVSIPVECDIRGTDDPILDSDEAVDDGPTFDDIPGALRDPLLDPDEYKFGYNKRKPNHLAIAIEQARDVHIDGMRVALEMHYDAVHRERWIQERNAGTARGRPQRKNQRAVYRAVSEYSQSSRNDSVKLPQKVKEIFRDPADEKDWKKLERFREAVLCAVEGETVVELPDTATAAAVVEAVKLQESGAGEGILAHDVCSAQDPTRVLIPCGARLELPSVGEQPRGKRARRDQLASFLEDKLFS